MFRDVNSAAYILIPMFFALVLLAPGATANAQAIVAEYGVPTECELAMNYNTVGSGFGNTHPSDHFTNIATNPTTNLTYGVLHCYEGLPARLLEMNGNDNSHRIVNIPLDPPESAYATIINGIAIDRIRNRIFLNTVSGHAARSNGIAVFDVNTETHQWFPLPAVWNQYQNGNQAYATGQMAFNSVTNRLYYYGLVYLAGSGVHELNPDDGTFRFLPNQYRYDISGIVLDETRNRLYTLVGPSSFYPPLGPSSAVQVFDLSTGQMIADESLCNSPYSDCLVSNGSMAVNPVTNRIYVHGGHADHMVYAWPLTSAIMVFRGDNFSRELLTLPSQVTFNNYSWGSVAVNPNTNRVYAPVFNGSVGQNYGLATLDGSLNTFGTKILETDVATTITFGSVVVNPVTGLLYVPLYRGSRTIQVIAPASSGTISVEQPIVQADAASLDFTDANLSGEGSVTVTPIADPSVAGEIPGGFAISNLIAYEITPDASLQFNGSVTTCFEVPTVNVQADFLALRVLHRELIAAPDQYGLVDRTSSHDFANRKICATTTSFSPFYLAKVGNKVNITFDRSRAFNAGSNVPIRLQMLDQNGQNISSSNLALTARNLRRLGENTTTAVASPGNSNSDNTFIYASGGYRYNLKTTDLTAGRYVLSFYVGTDQSFFYTIEFEVR